METPQWIKRITLPVLKGESIIPIYSPFIGQQERNNVISCLDDNWYSSKGRFVSEFEQRFANFVHSPFAVSCSSGTAALFLSLKSLGITSGDEVIVPTFTMASTAFAVSYCNAKPIFIDCESDTGNINVSLIESAITTKTKAIIPVHIYGTPCDMDKIHSIAKKYNLFVVEDAAEALGAMYKKKMIGNVSKLSIFSLYVNKIVMTGEGGMITMQSKRLYNKIKKLNNYSFSSVRHFWHSEIGYNFRLSNLEAALGVGQLTRVNEILHKKERIHRWYAELLAPLGGSFISLVVPSNRKSNYWHIAYRIVNSHVDRMALRNYLAGNGVETRGFFIPMHLQPAYRKEWMKKDFPHADMLAKTGLLLPSGPGLTYAQVSYICSRIIPYVNTHHGNQCI